MFTRADYTYQTLGNNQKLIGVSVLGTGRLQPEQVLMYDRSAAYR